MCVTGFHSGRDRVCEVSNCMHAILLCIEITIPPYVLICNVFQFFPKSFKTGVDSTGRNSS